MDVVAWARGNPPGTRVVYAEVADDASLPQGSQSLRTAMEAHTLGLVFLAQRRVDGMTQYTATRISPETSRKLDKFRVRSADLERIGGRRP